MVSEEINLKAYNLVIAVEFPFYGGGRWEMEY
jgi:hypothetical protein